MRLLPILIALATIALFSCDKEESSSEGDDINGTWRHYIRAQDLPPIKPKLDKGNYFTHQYLIFNQDEYCSYSDVDGCVKIDECIKADTTGCLRLDVKGNEIIIDGSTIWYYRFKADTLLINNMFNRLDREVALIKQ